MLSKLFMRITIFLDLIRTKISKKMKKIKTLYHDFKMFKEKS
jgi:hypothetical protein